MRRARRAAGLGMVHQVIKALREGKSQSAAVEAANFAALGYRERAPLTIFTACFRRLFRSLRGAMTDHLNPQNFVGEGLYRPVHVKTLSSQKLRVLLGKSQQLEICAGSNAARITLRQGIRVCTSARARASASSRCITRRLPTPKRGRGVR
jgi:hypothetical protein